MSTGISSGGLIGDFYVDAGILTASSSTVNLNVTLPVGGCVHVEVQATSGASHTVYLRLNSGKWVAALSGWTRKNETSAYFNAAGWTIQPLGSTEGASRVSLHAPEAYNEETETTQATLFFGYANGYLWRVQ